MPYSTPTFVKSVRKAIRDQSEKLSARQVGIEPGLVLKSEVEMTKMKRSRQQPPKPKKV